MFARRSCDPNSSPPLTFLFPASTMKACRSLILLLATVGSFCLTITLRADVPAPGYWIPDWLDFWSFYDTNGWHSDLDHAPISFTNLNSSFLGNWQALGVDSATPAWINYKICMDCHGNADILMHGVLPQDTPWFNAAGTTFRNEQLITSAYYATVGGPGLGLANWLQYEVDHNAQQNQPAPGPQVATTTPPGSLDLSPSATWGNANTLERHFDDHGGDFGATSARDYANQASQFLQRSQTQGLPTKIDADGVIRTYDPVANTFGSFNANGTTRTFFKPSSPTYFQRQPGTLR
jgi:hypothetical protein